MNVIRQPFLCHSPITLKSALSSAATGPSCLLMSPIQASALKSAYSYEPYNASDDEDEADNDLEELSFESSSRPLLMKRRLRLEYVSDYEWDEDNDYLEDYATNEEDDACSTDSERTKPVSNKTYDLYHHCGKFSPSSSSTGSTATMNSVDCSVSSGISFDSEVAVSKHHQPTPTYHQYHCRHSSPTAVQSPASAAKETRHSFSTEASAADINNNTSAKVVVKKPFVRADLMPTKLSSSQRLSPPSPSSCRPVGRRLFRTSSCRSAASAMTV